MTISKPIQDFIKTRKLGFVATVCPDGTPNLSPKGTTTVWDDEHLIFADIHSPETTKNLLTNPSIEINVVDVFTRKGYRFKGTASVVSQGEIFERALTFYKEAAQKYKINNFIIIKVERIIEVTSPAYDAGDSEEAIRERWVEYWNSIHHSND